MIAEDTDVMVSVEQVRADSAKLFAARRARKDAERVLDAALEAERGASSKHHKSLNELMKAVLGDAHDKDSGLWA